MHWRLIRGPGSGPLEPAAGARNMAVDHALLESVQRGGPPVVRFYLWQPACLSLGRNQHARGLYDPDVAATAGIDIVRRPTGGLAVLHDRELTYSVAAPLPLFGGPRAAYQAINVALVEGLRALGVPAECAGSSPVRGPRQDAAVPCFQAPAPGEVVAAGRKLVGSAQRCESGALLQHGSILLDGSQARVRSLQHAPVHTAGHAGDAGDAGTRPDGSISLARLLGATPAPEAVASALVAGFQRVLGTCLAPATLTREEVLRADTLEARYAAADWTWRR